MSHFTVLVIGENPEEQLAPYNENTSSCDKEWLEFGDEEDEYLKKYNEGEKEMIKMPDGRLLFSWDDEFKKKDAIGFGTNTHEVPDNLEKVMVKHKDRYPTFENFMEEWAGYEERDPQTGRYGHWHNPNAKWDWYELGGRWSGYFKLKDHIQEKTSITQAEKMVLALNYGLTVNVVDKYIDLFKKGKDAVEKEMFNNPISGGFHFQRDLENIIKPKYDTAKLGATGLGANIAKGGYADQALKKDIDFEGMVKEAEDKAKNKYEKLERLLGETIPKLEYSWEEVLEGEKFKEWDINKKRDFYHGQEAKNIINKAVDNKSLSDDDRSFLRWLEIEDYQCSKEDYIKKAGEDCISTYALVKDGKWYKKGDMGWFGCSSNEKDQKKWNEEFIDILKNLPDDTMLSVYDCHI